MMKMRERVDRAYDLYDRYCNSKTICNNDTPLLGVYHMLYEQTRNRPPFRCHVFRAYLIQFNNQIRLFPNGLDGAAQTLVRLFEESCDYSSRILLMYVSSSCISSLSKPQPDDFFFLSNCGYEENFLIRHGHEIGRIECLKTYHYRLARCCRVIKGRSRTICSRTMSNQTSLRDSILPKFDKSVFEKCCRALNMSLDDAILKEIECGFLLFTSLQGCSDVPSMASTIGLFLSRYFEESMSRTILHYVSSLLMSNQSDETNRPKWLDILKNARTDWHTLRSSPFMGHFSRLLGLLVTVQMCKAASVTFRLGQYTFFEPDMMTTCSTASDLFDAVSGTVVFFVEKMYDVFKTGSLDPLLLGESESVALDEEYCTILSYWSLIVSGNLYKVKQVTDNEFDNRLESLSAKFKSMITPNRSFENKILQGKLTELLKIKNDYTTLKISGGIREAPFVVELFGESNQGKTTCGDQIVDALLVSANLPTSREFRANYNDGDRYHSSWRSDKLVLTIDDMANSKSDKVEKPPTAVIVEACNNAVTPANMADLPLKGKVFLEPKIVVVNTNVKSLDAYQYSNCPYSIQRRMHAVITVKAKKEFQLMLDGDGQGIDPRKVQAHYEANGRGSFDDIWDLTIERAVKPREMHNVASYVPIEYNGKLLKDISMQEALEYLIDVFHEHNKAQRHLVEYTRNRCDNIRRCPVDDCKNIEGYCSKHAILQNQSGLRPMSKLSSALSDISAEVTTKVKTDLLNVTSMTEAAVTTLLLTQGRAFIESWDWIAFAPSCLIENPVFIRFMMLCNKDLLRTRYVTYSIFQWFVCFTLFVFYVCNDEAIFGMLFCICFLLVSLRQWCMMSIIRTYYIKELVKRNSINEMLRVWRDVKGVKVWQALGAASIVYAIAQLWRVKTTLSDQSGLSPSSEDDVKERDSSENPWAHVIKRPIASSHEVKTMTRETLQTIVSKNLVHAEYVFASGKRTISNALFLRTSLCIIPSHYFVEDEFNVVFRRTNPQSSGGKFQSRVSKKWSYLLPNSDLRVCYIPAGGSFRDIRKWIPSELETEGSHEMTLLWRKSNGTVKVMSGVAERGTLRNETTQFSGGYFKNLSCNTYPGLCGGVALSHENGSSIVGIHVAGFDFTKEGAYCSISRRDLDRAVDSLSEVDGILLSGSNSDFPNEILGKKIIKEDCSLHPKSPVNYMPDGTQICYHGECGPPVKSSSDVRDSYISEYVTYVTGVHNVWGPPEFNPQWKGWQTCLSQLSTPATDFPHELLSLAVNDYKTDIFDLLDSQTYWKRMRPLIDHENVNGIAGCKFIDAIKIDTAIGFPLTGPKSDFMEEFPSNPGDVPNRRFKYFIMEEIVRCENLYERGERAFAIAKACKKDEILGKKKCRIFYSNPISMIYLVRKYFLPITRFLQMNPLVSECAIGVNCHGPEWQELYTHMMRFGKERIIGGDYSKYDQRLPAQVLNASYRILIDIAAKCDYTPRDISIMKAMVSDMVYAYINFNGCLISLQSGGQISGTPLTAPVNGLCGSLNSRCVFYTLYPPLSFDTRRKFRDHVSLMVYGDDNGGTVSKDAPLFSIESMSEVLREYGQIYTMPNKESEIVPYIPENDFEFLKRSDKYCPRKNCSVGALNEDSIFKMLHCVLRPKGSPLTKEMSSAVNIDMALVEWANHGEDLFEYRRKQMNEVAEMAGIANLCKNLECDYGEFVNRWKKQYTS